MWRLAATGSHATMCRLLGVSFVLEGYDPHLHIRAKVAV
jgi:hypothetical protein